MLSSVAVLVAVVLAAPVYQVVPIDGVPLNDEAELQFFGINERGMIAFNMHLGLGRNLAVVHARSEVESFGYSPMWIHAFGDDYVSMSWDSNGFIRDLATGAELPLGSVEIPPLTVYPIPSFTPAELGVKEIRGGVANVHGEMAILAVPLDGYSLVVYRVTPVPVPEPGTAALAVMGAVAMMWCKGRRRA